MGERCILQHENHLLTNGRVTKDQQIEDEATNKGRAFDFNSIN